MRRVYKEDYLEVFRLFDNKNDYLARIDGKDVIRFPCDSEEKIPDIMPSVIGDYLQHLDDNPDFVSGKVRFSIDCSIPLSDLIKR